MKTQDIVYTIEEFWDCPREGVAEYNGKAVYYKCLFDDAADDWSEVFELQELKEESLPEIFATEGNWRDWSHNLPKKILHATGQGAGIQQSFIQEGRECIRRKAKFSRFAKGCWNGYLVEWDEI